LQKIDSEKPQVFTRAENAYLRRNLKHKTIMKGLLLGLFVVALGTTVSAQTTKSMKKMKKDAKTEMNATADTQDQKIKDALMKDEEIQKATLDYLTENEDTQKQVAKIAKEAEGSKTGIMDAILKNEALTTAAIDYVKSNPELLEKAMSLIGM
jgi:hypothetical protein